MLLNILFSALLDGKYLTVGMDAACLLPAKGTLGLKEDFGIMQWFLSLKPQLSPYK